MVLLAVIEIEGVWLGERGPSGGGRGRGDLFGKL